MTTEERLEKLERELAAAKQINRWKLTAVVLAASLLCMVAKEGFFVTPAKAESMAEFETRCKIRDNRREINAINSRSQGSSWRMGTTEEDVQAPPSVSSSPAEVAMPRDNRIIRSQPKDINIIPEARADPTVISSVRATIFGVYIKVTGSLSNCLTVNLRYSLQSTTSERRVKQPIAVLFCLWIDSRGKRHLKYGFLDGHTGGYNSEMFTKLGELSMQNPEIDVGKYSNANILKRNLIHLPDRGRGGKLEIYRIEIWQNGNIIANKNSYPAGMYLQRLKLPDDWYIYNKYPDKISY